jgi:hypothetical protein
MRFVSITLLGLTVSMPQSASQAALLVGLHVDSSGDAPSYRTFLITSRNGKAQLAARLSEPVVPVGEMHQ